MSYDFRKDLRELLILIAIAAAGFFAAFNLQAQPYKHVLTLDMVVERTPLRDSANIQSLSQTWREAHQTSTIERVRLIYPNRDIIILETAKDTLELELISVFENCTFIDNKNPDQKYLVIRDLRKRSFYYTFTPMFPLSRHDMYAIHIEPYLLQSSK